MQKVKTHNFIVRGIEKDVKNRLKRKAIKNKRSVNKEILMAVDYYLAAPEDLTVNCGEPVKTVA